MKDKESIDMIDAAILAHRGWVSRFRTALEGINTEFFDLEKTVDHLACDFGKWLQRDSSRRLFDEQAMKMLQDAHVRFHAICGELARRLNQRSMDLQQSDLIELDNTSREIVRLLRQGRIRCG